MSNINNRYSRDQIAARVAQDIPEGAYVNLGIGLPTKVANYLPAEREVFLHSENGLLGMGPAPAPGEEDEDLINAGKQPVTLLTGGAYFHHGDSFAMMRGGHLDVCVLGAFQVSEHGDLANWHTGAPDAIPAVGGAMDLAIGAKQVFVMMDHLTKTGESKIVDQCTYPLTGVACVNRIYTDMAVLDVTPDGLAVDQIAPTVALQRLDQREVGVDRRLQHVVAAVDQARLLALGQQRAVSGRREEAADAGAGGADALRQIPLRCQFQLDLAGTVQRVEVLGVSLARERADDLAYPFGLEQRGQSGFAVALSLIHI